MTMSCLRAYDSVPRPALWRVLEKCGVPPSNSFEVKDGLRQGCILFLTSTLVPWFLVGDISASRSELAFFYKHGRKLVGDSTAKSRLENVTITES